MARLLPEAFQISWRADPDHELVTAVRRGDDSAFEELFSRYRGRIRSYVSGIIGDSDRAEDISQEVFISVLRRLRATERPIVFRPWVYRIAKNACIDELRRARHGHEVVPLEHHRESAYEAADLFSSTPGPDAAVESKQQLEDLRGAFRGVSELHHRILVLRELEGLSYSEIGDRLGMSRPVVESTLFRARRRLAEEYEELISGRRCERTRAVIDAWEGRTLRRLGVRETRQLSRHLSHCQPCRRHALLSRADGAVPMTAGGVPMTASGVPMTASAVPRPLSVAALLPLESPIPLASRRRPAREGGALAAPEPDSLAVA